MRKVQDLTAADFPGVDPGRFEEWKQALKDAERNTIYLLAGLVVLNIVLYLVFDSIMLGGLLLLLVFFFIWRTPNRLAKELGLTNASIRAARKRPGPGEAVLPG